VLVCATLVAKITKEWWRFHGDWNQMMRLPDAAAEGCLPIPSSSFLALGVNCNQLPFVWHIHNNSARLAQGGKILKEHVKFSDTNIMAAALSNSPQ